jgi:hypothetical protein
MPDTRSMLLKSLENLAADAEAQERYLREIGTWPSLDELVLEFDDLARSSEAWAPALLRERIARWIASSMR